MCDGTLVKEQAEQIELLLKRIEVLERKLKAYENAHTPPSRSFKRRHLKSPEEKGKPGQKPCHEGTTRECPTPDKTIEVQSRDSQYNHPRVVNT